MDGNKTVEANRGEKERKGEQIIDMKDIKLKHRNARREHCSGPQIDFRNRV